MAETAETTLDIPYPSGFYSFQTPALLDYVAAINGIAPALPQGASFTYLDLGCGDGFTLILLAAAYPQCRFIGVDLNPEHIATGNALARDGGLANLHLIEAGFEQWRALALPECDYIAMHGVYAWISEPAREAVLTLLADRLRLGGLAYVSYNAYPGWASIAPLRQFLLDYTRGMAGDTLHNVAAAIRHLQELRAKGAAYFADNPRAAAMLDDFAKKDIRYVAHEIYVPHWSPQSFSAVLGQMRRAGLVFVGSASLADNYARPSVRAEFLPLLLKETDRARAELHRDYVNNTFFRRDVFAKLEPGTAKRDVGALVEAVLLGTVLPYDQLRRSAPLPGGEMPLEGEPFESLRRLLAGGARRLAELRALPPFRALPPGALGQAVQIMATGSQIVPFAAPGPVGAAPDGWTIPLALNRRLIRRPVDGNPYVLVAAPALGSAVVVPRDEALVLLAVAEAPANAADWAWDHAVSAKAWLHAKGTAAMTPGAHAAAFAEVRQALARRLAKLVELGVIVPR